MRVIVTGRKAKLPRVPHFERNFRVRYHVSSREAHIPSAAAVRGRENKWRAYIRAYA